MENAIIEEGREFFRSFEGGKAKDVVLRSPLIHGKVLYTNDKTWGYSFEWSERALKRFSLGSGRPRSAARMAPPQS